MKERGYEANEEEIKEILRRIKERKAEAGKEEVRRMVKEVRLFYERYLNFPSEAFGEIVEGVLIKDD